MKGKKWIKRIIWLIVIGLIAVVLLSTLTNARKIEYQSDVVKSRNIETFYTFSGNIEPDEVKVIYATSGNKVKSVEVEEGAFVAEDDRIIKTQSGSSYKAPQDGTLTDVYVEKDDFFAAGQEIARIATYDKPVVVISIDEYDISAIHTGDAVTVYLQAMDKSYDGVITQVDKEATVTNNVAYYSARVALEQDGNLLMGMTCEVSVPKESAQDVATIPLSYVKFDDENKPYVYCYDRKDEVITQYVSLGVNNGTIVQVKDGVEVGDVVLTPKTSNRLMSMSNMANR